MDWSVWERLGLELDRGAEQVYRRWWGGIEHVLTRHLAGESCILTYIQYFHWSRASQC